MIKNLQTLIGHWTGTGFAEYPSIASKVYTEELVFSTNEFDPVIQYEQKTWVKDSSNGEDQPIFWECGFIIQKEEEVLMVNTQKSGRMESLLVTIEEKDHGHLKMIATAQHYLNDPRMISSKRIFTVSANRIDYEMYMGTRIVDNPDEMKLHLKATLQRRDFVKGQRKQMIRVE